MVGQVAASPGGKTGGGFTAQGFRVPRHYLELLVGADAAEALTAHAGASGAFRAEGDALPSMLFLNLCLEQMRRTEDEAVGAGPVRVARGTFGLLLAAAAQGDTFAEGLRRFTTAVPIMRPDKIITLRRSRRGLSLTLDYHGERDPRRDMLTEIFALTAHCGFRWLTGRRLRPSALRIASAMAPVGPSLLLPVVAETAPRRGRGVTITYTAEDAEAPIRPVKYQHWAAHELGEFTSLLEEAAQERLAPTGKPAPDILAQVRAVIGPEAWDEPSAASRLGMSTATLRRRLAEAGASFRALSSDTRRRAAANLLATEHSLEDVAAQLGFSDARSLRRACKAWFGVAPAEYRKTAR